MKKLTILQVRQALNSQEASAVLVRVEALGTTRRVERPSTGWSENRSGQFSGEQVGPNAFHFSPKNVLEIIK